MSSFFFITSTVLVGSFFCLLKTVKKSSPDDPCGVVIKYQKLQFNLLIIFNE